MINEEISAIISEIFYKRDIPEGCYSINEPKEDAFCLDERVDGFHLYTVERGVENDDEVYDDLKEACNRFVYHVVSKEEKESALDELEDGLSRLSSNFEKDIDATPKMVALSIPKKKDISGKTRLSAKKHKLSANKEVSIELLTKDKPNAQFNKAAKAIENYVDYLVSNSPNDEELLHASKSLTDSIKIISRTAQKRIKMPINASNRRVKGRKDEK